MLCCLFITVSICKEQIVWEGKQGWQFRMENRDTSARGEGCLWHLPLDIILIVMCIWFSRSELCTEELTAEKTKSGRGGAGECRQSIGTSLNPATNCNGTCCAQAHNFSGTKIIGLINGLSVLTSFLLQLSYFPVNLPSVLDQEHIFSPASGGSQAGRSPFSPLCLQFQGEVSEVTLSAARTRIFKEGDGRHQKQRDWELPKERNGCSV